MGFRDLMKTWLFPELTKASDAPARTAPPPPYNLTEPFRSGFPTTTDWTTDNGIANGLKASAVVYACCAFKARNISTLPWIVEERTRKGEWARAAGHPLETLLQQPNAYMSGQDLFEWKVLEMELGGNALWSAVPVDGVPVQLWPIRPDKIKPIPDARKWLQAYRYWDGFNWLDLDPAIITHVQYSNPANYWWGLAPLQAAGKAVDTDNAAVTWNLETFGTRLRPDGVFWFKQYLDEDAFYDTNAKIQTRMAQNTHAPLVLSGDGQFIPLSQNALEMDYTNSRKGYADEICLAFGVPLSVLRGDQAGGGLNNNLTPVLKSVWQNTLCPLALLFANKMTNSLCRWWNPDAAYGAPLQFRVMPDFSKVPALQEDETAKARTAQLYIQMGFPPNEVNQKLNLGFKPLPGGDVPKPAAIPQGIQPGLPAPSSAEATAGKPAQKAFVLKADPPTRPESWTEEQRAAWWAEMDGVRQQWEQRASEEFGRVFLQEGAEVSQSMEHFGENMALLQQEAGEARWQARLAELMAALVAYYGTQAAQNFAATAGLPQVVFSPAAPVVGATPFATPVGLTPASVGSLPAAAGGGGGIPPMVPPAAAAGAAGAAPTFTPFRPTVEEYLRTVSAQKVKQISETTRAAIRQAILDGYAAQETPPEIAARIAKIYTDWATESPMTAHRALVIARTEVGSAASWARRQGVLQESEHFQIPTEKVWITMRDPRVRPQHQVLDGQVRPLNEPYSNGLLHPGDPNGPADQVIQCRCWETYQVVQPKPEGGA